MLKRGTTYQELGGDFFNQLEPERVKRYHIKRLEALGYRVLLQPAAYRNFSGQDSKRGTIWLWLWAR